MIFGTERLDILLYKCTFNEKKTADVYHHNLNALVKQTFYGYVETGMPVAKISVVSWTESRMVETITASLNSFHFFRVH